MLNISKPYLMLLVSAVNDAIKYNKGFLRSQTIKDVSDYEDHLLCLENLQGWLEDEYKRLATEHSDLPDYEKIIRRSA